MEVVKLSKKDCSILVLNKHYSKRMPIFWKGFGLVINKMIEGVVIYGQPSPAIQRYAFIDRDFKLLELSRLVIQTSEKNAASYLVGNSLKMLEKPCAVVSYADTAYNHAGIVYQATNWLYTGATVSHDNMYLVDGELVHAMTLIDRFGITKPVQFAKENNIEIVKPKPKHRYFYLCGSKKEKRKMKDKLRYEIISAYPKLNKQKYDDGSHIRLPYAKGLFNKTGE